MSNRETFQSALERAYVDLFAHDTEYAYAAARTTPADLAAKMTAGLVTGSANKDGAGIRRGHVRALQAETEQRREVLAAVAIHGADVLTFELARQDRRTYYRLLCNGKGAGSLTDLKHARETIAYWRSKGWIKS